MYVPTAKNTHAKIEESLHTLWLVLQLLVFELCKKNTHTHAQGKFVDFAV
jgi:hypothetical protein